MNQPTAQTGVAAIQLPDLREGTALKIVDPHVHLWDLWTGLYPHFEKPSKGRNGSNAAIARSYLLEEFLDEGEGQFEIVGAVHVEAFPTDPVEETETLQRVADKSPISIVTVSNEDLTSPDFPVRLDRHAHPARGMGWRHPVLRYRPFLRTRAQRASARGLPHRSAARRVHCDY